MDRLNKTKTQNPTIYVYTQHIPTIRVIEEVCNKVVVLSQNRSIDPVDDVLSQVGGSPAVLYAVLPIDKAVVLRQRAPHLTLRLLQLDGAVIERLTGTYDPKSEYPPEIIRLALKVIEVKSGFIRYMTFKEMIDEIIERGFRKIGVFNDVMREGFKLALQRLGVDVELVKTCNSDCVQVNPLGFQSGYRVSFPAVSGRLTPEQIAEALFSGARIYYVEIDAEAVPLCGEKV
jgi:hypothetical protein